VPTTSNYFHLHLVSDSTGETLITVARAVAAQYANVTPVEHVYPLVRSQKQLDRVLSEIEEAPGIVLFTLLEKDLVGRLEAKCQELAHCVGLLDAAEATVRERTIWAQSAEAQRAGLAAQNSTRVSFWTLISWAAASRSARYQ